MSIPSENSGNVLTKQQSAMTEGIANAIMCCKHWLGYDEFSQQDMILERELVEENRGEDDHDIEVDGDDGK